MVSQFTKILGAGLGLVFFCGVASRAAEPDRLEACRRVLREFVRPNDAVSSRGMSFFDNATLLENVECERAVALDAVLKNGADPLATVRNFFIRSGLHGFVLRSVGK